MSTEKDKGNTYCLLSEILKYLKNKLKEIALLGYLHKFQNYFFTNCVPIEDNRKM